MAFNRSSGFNAPKAPNPPPAPSSGIHITGEASELFLNEDGSGSVLIAE